ncbi:two-component regulator propeller domain-containing protein [Prolixibacteraceae bacterium]|nr:two-component regulator propeller domain-containing protein [Prolixibacteraceae bacterium]
MYIRTLLWTIIFLLTAVYKTLASPVYSFNQLSIKDGLQESYITCMTKDHNGNMWIGNREGLNCYDGYNIKTYNFSPLDQESIPSDEIHFIVEDKQNNIWVGTSRGLARFDPSINKFKRIEFDDSPLLTYSAIQLKTKIIFSTSFSRLIEYNYKTQEFSEFISNKDIDPFPFFKKMIKLDNNTILANSKWKGVYSINIKDKSVVKIKIKISPHTPAIFLDSHDKIWISDLTDGVRCFDRNWNLIHYFTSKNSPLTHDIILDFEEQNNNLWLATDGGGINIISLNDLSFSSIQNKNNDTHSLPWNSFNCLYNDPDNNMWLGSTRSGLIKVSKTYSEIFNKVPFGSNKGLSNQTILYLYEDKNNKIWIGTDGGGINLFDPIQKTFKHFKSTKDKKVTGICNLNNNELLISTYTSGVFRFNKHTGAIVPFTIFNNQTQKIITLQEPAISLNNYGDNKIILIGNHMYLYDIDSLRFNILASQGIDYHYTNLEKVAENSSKVYFASRVEVIELDRATKKTKCIYTSDLPDIINDACMDSKGQLWLASSSGLTHYDPTNDTTINRINGISFRINTILCDKNDQLWLGAKNMVYTYNIHNKNLRTINDSYNTPLNGFIPHSKLIAKSGDIYMGGVLGLSIINRDINFPSIANRPLFIEKIQLNGKDISRVKNFKNGSLSIPWNFSALRIKLKVKGNLFYKKRFRYKIVGINNKYIETFDHNIDIYSLPTGSFNIIGSYKSANGNWTTPKQIIEVRVTPPWWRNNIFYTILFLLIILTSIAIHLNISKIRTRNQQIEINKIKERLYEDKVNFFININHELRTPLTLIYAPLQRYFATNSINLFSRSDLKSIFTQAKNMMNIINTLLDMRSMEVQKDKTEISLCKLNRWVKSKAHEFSNELKERDIDIIFNLDRSITSTPWDIRKGEMILSNLMMNALKYSNDHTTITISTEKLDDHIKIAVKDQGIGINEEEIEKLFSNFYQGGHNIQGNGIGLSYAQMLVNQLGGRINAYKNRDERGSTFYFEIPTNLSINTDIATDNETNITIQEVPLIGKLQTKEYSIIIIEDNQDLREMECNHLKKYFKNVYTANNGEHGLEKIYKYQPDIIVSDIMMPKLNGFELCKVVKNDFKISHIPIILLTAYNNPKNTLNGYKLGANAYVPKPFQFDLLMSVITTQLRNREFVKRRYQNFSLPMVDPKETTISSIDEDFISKFIKLVDNNLDNPDLDLKMITKQMFMSRSSVSNKIKSLMGISIMEYVIQERIKKAIELLLQTNKNITQISTEVGFSSSRYFSTVFKEKQKMTPSNFRLNRKSIPNQNDL